LEQSVANLDDSCGPPLNLAEAYAMVGRVAEAAAMLERAHACAASRQPVDGAMLLMASQLWLDAANTERASGALSAAERAGLPLAAAAQVAAIRAALTAPRAAPREGAQVEGSGVAPDSGAR
jgi:hypothetical protein